MFLVHETDKAKLFRREDAKPGEKDIWIPRNVIKYILKMPPLQPNTLSLCELKIDDWFAKKEKL